MARRRHFRRNPFVSTTLFFVLGGAGLLTWLLTRKASAASSTPGTTENCKVAQIQMSNYISLGLQKQAACQAGDKTACNGAITLGLQVMAMQKAWLPACGPVPQVPSNTVIPGTTENCKVVQTQMSDFISLGLTKQKACQAGDKQSCDDATTLGLQVMALQKSWPAACGPIPTIPTV